MKKVIILTLLLAFVTVSFCQQTVQKHSLTQADYLQKSKKQKKTALIFLGGGAALIVTSLLIPQGEPTGSQFDPLTGGFYEGYKNDGIKGALGLTGVVSMLGSIPFFIASGKTSKEPTGLPFLLMSKGHRYCRKHPLLINRSLLLVCK